MAGSLAAPWLQLLLDCLNEEIWILPAIIGMANTLRIMSAQVLRGPEHLGGTCMHANQNSGTDVLKGFQPQQPVPLAGSCMATAHGSAPNID
jgi:hypothetical protein